MRIDTDAVGGFFEDLPVLVFVLAGVLSVAGTACWTSEQRSEISQSDSLEDCAHQLVVSVALDLRATGAVPSADAIRCANLSGPLSSLPDGTAALVSIWCVHPGLELLLTAADLGGDPQVAFFDRMFMNALFEGGMVGIVEVRVLVWEAGQE